MIRPSALLLVISLVGTATSSALAQVLLSGEEIAMTLSHGPWPPAFEPDPSNRVSGLAAAIALGETLFFDPVLSRDRKMSCASCHDLEHGFAEPRARAIGNSLLDRNTPSVVNVRVHRWFGWAGDTDNLWAQSLTPILSSDEMGFDPADLKAALENSAISDRYVGVFGSISEQSADDVVVNISKALAAYQETLITGPTSFDRFRDALEAGDLASASQYPLSAQRGLQLFLGRGNCAFCHSGPAFTNGEFHDAGVPYFVTETRVDTGRYGGLQALSTSPFTLAGTFSDDPLKRGAWAIRQVRPQHSDFGTFRVPSLRGAANTAPYMHNGSLADLQAVVQHYNTIDLERLHADGEAILAPLGLSERESSDLIQFLNSLGDDPR
ncbi:cytochrome-c peroxidase [Litoreibacter janthinus]|uniref:Cytochrome c peroxidase n=1 Tax=Litoreibacter janthinus TaxID=670154 RepID=A0A1I6GCN4_9RHOB|nr:cytochrome c peroxidase [Litoreibacter janthinus]SFR39974.1 cytochrome c peroxidase [Litoreibacter janthinus]